MRKISTLLLLSGFFYITISIFQISAVADALKLILMINNTFLEGILFIISLFITFTHILGPVLGIIGATFVWDWNILLAFLLFFWPYFFGGIVWFLSNKNKIKNKKEKKIDAEDAEIIREWKR